MDNPIVFGKNLSKKSAFEEAVAAGQGAIAIDGVMVDAASIRLVQNLLDRAQLYGL